MPPHATTRALEPPAGATGLTMERVPSFVAWFWRGCTAIIVVLALYTHIWVALIVYPLLALALELAYRRSRRRT